MKRWWLLLFCALCWGAHAADLRWGISGFEGITYSGQPAFGWTASAIQCMVVAPSGILPGGWRPEAGLELGAAGLGAQALVPLGAVWTVDLQDGWSAALAAHALAGLTFQRPLPQFLWGGEGEIHAQWAWQPGAAVGLSLGLRYTQAPGYSSAVTPYAVFEAPLLFYLDL